MTSAERAFVTAIGAAALVLGTAAVGLAVPGSETVASRLPAHAAAWPGYPMVPAGPSRAAAAAGPDTSNITAVDSLNWSGYGVSRHNVSFRSVQATFFVPYLHCTKTPRGTLSSDWVGLDGFVGKPDSVEQGGISANCSASGRAAYHGWYEMFPRPEIRASISVRAGDSVTATISYDAADKDFRISLADNTAGEHFSVLRKCPAIKIGKLRLSCPRNSAEAVSEAPANGTSKHLVIASLSDYGAVSYADIAIIDSAGHHGSLVSSHWNTTKIIQVRASSGLVVARPTPTQDAMFDSYWVRQN
jgi:Peptidase A4 family